MVAQSGATDDDWSVSGARHQIGAAMLELPNVSVAPHRFGGDEYRLGRRELGMSTATRSSISPSLHPFATRSSPPS